MESRYDSLRIWTLTEDKFLLKDSPETDSWALEDTKNSFS